MFHVHATWKDTHCTITVAKGKGPLSDWTRDTLEGTQNLAMFACRMALIYGYGVTLDLGDDTDDLLTYTPGDAHYSDTIDHTIGSFHWQSKAV